MLDVVLAKSRDEVVRVVVALFKLVDGIHSRLVYHTSWNLSFKPSTPASLAAFCKFSGKSWPLV